MKIKQLIIGCMMILPGVIQAEVMLLDKIECVVCGPEKNTPFTDTNITWKRSLEGKFVPLEQQIQHEIVSQQFVTDKVPSDPAGVEKYIEGIKKQNNFSESDLENWFNDVGRLMQEGLDELRQRYEYEYFMHYKFKSQLVPTEDEIVAYYNEYPDFIEGYWDVRASRIEFDDTNKDEVAARVKALVADPQSKAETVEWSPTTRFMDDDISEQNEFVRKMKDGEVKAIERDGGYDVYQLMSHEPTRIRPLEECRNFIIDTLNRKKLEKMLKAHNDSVREYIDVIQL